MMRFQALRGTTDLLGETIPRWIALEETIRRLMPLYGYQEIRTPLIEEAALFFRTVGETTDIVQKEMFHLEDRGDHGMVLRPEGTAAVVRAYLEHDLHKTQGFAKLFYLGPMFRAERPQAGRFRQFHQYGVEAIGSLSPWVDIEVIVLCFESLRACGVSPSSVWLSSMGCRADQERSAVHLRERLAASQSKLCRECQSRFEKNVFRVLDCKEPTCHEIAWDLTGSPFLLCSACEVHFDAVRRGLINAQVPVDDTKVFARGLDYYTRTVFEVRVQGLGAQDAIAAGGRYDHLVEELGGPALGAVGFAAGIERVLLAMAKGQHKTPGTATRRGVYLAVTQSTLLGAGFQFVRQLRERNVWAIMDYDGKSLKAQLREADKSGCHLVAILGEAELKQRTMTLKDLAQGTQSTVSFETFVDEVAQQLIE